MKCVCLLVLVVLACLALTYAADFDGQRYPRQFGFGRGFGGGRGGYGRGGFGGGGFGGRRGFGGGYGGGGYGRRGGFGGGYGGYGK